MTSYDGHDDIQSLWQPDRDPGLADACAPGESYPREIARLLGVSLSVVQKAIRSLEFDGLIAGRSVGRTRVYSLNPAYLAADEVRNLARRLAEVDADLRRAVGDLRTRPRRTGKRL